MLPPLAGTVLVENLLQCRRMTAATDHDSLQKTLLRFLIALE